jgi:large subunit ribosomal protein L9
VELILRTDVDGIGHRGDVVQVADGYGRNYLLPRGLAMKSTPGARAQAETMARARAAQDAEEKAAAEAVASQLGGKAVTIAMRAGEEGKLFGSVTSGDILDAVAAQTQIELGRHAIDLDQSIKVIGTHEVVVRPHPEVEFPIVVEVTQAE